MSPDPLSESSIAASLDCFACAIARWNNSQRCRANSFFNDTAGDSASLHLFDILFKSQLCQSASTIKIGLQSLREADHSLIWQASKPGVGSQKFNIRARKSDGFGRYASDDVHTFCALYAQRKTPAQSRRFFVRQQALRLFGIVTRFRRPITPNLFGPVPISLPGI